MESGLQVTIDALKAAQAYGADAVLLVPGRMDVNPMPEPWEFRVKFDRKTGHITQVVEGDNARYQAYIDAHNRAYDAFQVAVRRLIPVARETRVVIALENVWNNLFVDPAHFAFFVNSFKNRWVKAYLDLGNHVKYAPTEQWVAALGKSIAKCHVKDFKLNPDGRGGNFCEIRDGSVDWPVVRKALDRVGYSDWMTIEGGSLRSTSSAAGSIRSSPGSRPLPGDALLRVQGWERANTSGRAPALPSCSGSKLLPNPAGLADRARVCYTGRTRYDACRRRL